MPSSAKSYNVLQALSAREVPRMESILFTGTAPTSSQRDEADHLEWLIKERFAFTVSDVEIPFVDTGCLSAYRGNESTRHLAYKESAVAWLTENGHKDIEIEGYAVYGESDVVSSEVTVECGQCPPERLLKVLARRGKPVLVLPYARRGDTIKGYLFKPTAHALIGSWAANGALPMMPTGWCAE